jgi:putative toxin-antitoxin system antitoxin component (TIGR02293 family)
MGDKEIVAALGGAAVLGRGARGRMRLADGVARGLPLTALEHVKQELRLADAEVAAAIGISPKTVSRRRRAPRKALGLVVSDRLYRVARLFALATEVLEDTDRARAWLRAVQPGLANRSPLDLLSTEAGARAVEDLLGRIEHGVFS